MKHVLLATADMQFVGLADLIADRVERRERGHRLLENDRDASAADRPHRLAVGLQRREVDRRAVGFGIVEHHPAADDMGDLGQDAHDGLRDDRFAGARFSNQCDGAPGWHFE